MSDEPKKPYTGPTLADVEAAKAEFLRDVGREAATVVFSTRVVSHVLRWAKPRPDGRFAAVAGLQVLFSPHVGRDPGFIVV